MSRIGLGKEFKRKFPYTSEVKNCSVFNQILPLIKDSQTMFPAVRENTLDFYFGGSRPFHRGCVDYLCNNFFLNETREKGQESKELRLKSLPYKNSKAEHVSLDDILAKCIIKASRKKGLSESAQIAKLFPLYSFLKDGIAVDQPLLIDVEASFTVLGDEDGDRKNDRVDLTFILPESKELFFVEVKRRMDNRIRTANFEKNKPEVIVQVERYKKQIEQREDQILTAYSNVAESMHEIFGKSFPIPESILPTVPVLVVGDGLPGDLKKKKQTGDIWLEPVLKDMDDSDDRVQEKDGVLLFDGRAFFDEQEDRMHEFGAALNQVAQRIKNKEFCSL